MLAARRVVTAVSRQHQQPGARYASSTALGMFTEEEKMLKESVKKWAESEVKPHVRRMDAEKKMVGAFVPHRRRSHFDAYLLTFCGVTK
jgi:hypothetical protein